MSLSLEDFEDFFNKRFRGTVMKVLSTVLVAGDANNSNCEACRGLALAWALMRAMNP